MRALHLQKGLLVAAILAAGAASAASSLSAIERQIHRNYADGEYQRTVELIREHLETSPDDAPMLYKKARAYAQLGKANDAAAALVEAVKAGYRDFPEMRRDPALDPIREHPTYLALIEAAEEAGRRLAERSLEDWLERFGSREYRIERDEQRRLVFATALNRTAHREMREMLEQLADHLAETLFKAPPEYDVFIAIPTPRHARQLFERHNVGGTYQHRHRRLIARDTGSSLRHEFFHVMHYGHMERLNQSHRLWVQEGLASLYEDYDLSGVDSIVFLPNERNEIVRNRARLNRLIPWESIFELSSERFMARATVLYPQARSMFEFVAAEGKLQVWYESYIEHFEDDPTGATAFEEAFGIPVRDVEQQWRQWVSQQPAPESTPVGRGRASLGIGTRPDGANDGVLVTQVLPGSTASAGDIRVGDVVVAIDGRATTTLNDLRRILNGRSVGEQIEVRVRRDDHYEMLAIALRPLGDSQASEATPTRSLHGGSHRDSAQFGN